VVIKIILRFDSEHISVYLLFEFT